MTHVTCRLTAKNRDQLRNPTLGNWVWATFTFYLPCLLLICILCLSHAVKAGGSGDVWCGGCSESGSGQDGDWRFMYNTASVVTGQTDEYSWAAQHVLSLDTDHCTLQFTVPPGIQVKQELLRMWKWKMLRRIMWNVKVLLWKWEFLLFKFQWFRSLLQTMMMMYLLGYLKKQFW